MNYARFKDALRDFGSLLSELGVPNEAIDDILVYAEATAIPAELAARHDRQYAMEFKREGVAAVAKRYGISPQAARKRFNRVISKPNSLPEVASAVA